MPNKPLSANSVTPYLLLDDAVLTTPTIKAAAVELEKTSLSWGIWKRE